MCGILGLINLPSINIETGIRRLRHRGPDAKDVWRSSSGHVQLGHVRLSVLDLSPTGAQPMATPCGRYIITFNGEVYNFAELRRELEAEGVTFRGTNDTEVVLHAFIRWGERCLQRFNGMFAFAIYDRGSESAPEMLFLARDRAGEKPLYYSQEGTSLQFASELKALELKGGIDAAALNLYLALGYFPGEATLIEGIKKLPSGHFAKFNLASGEFVISPYWSLPVSSGTDATEAELVEEAERLLMDSVRLRMIADVPLGIFLSGGLDSSLITAAAARQSSAPVKTFTIVTPFGKYDESAFARLVSKFFGTEHYELEAGQDTLEIFDEIAGFVDEPIADSSLIPTYMVSKLTRKHVTVALGGDGGDELFGGYHHYQQALKDQVGLAMVPRPVLNTLASLVANLPAGVKGRNRLSALRNGPVQPQIWGTSFFDATLRKRILHGDTTQFLGHELYAPENLKLAHFLVGKDPIDGLTRMDFSTILQDGFLVKVDRASMANSLEVRAPFLDHRLIEFAFSVLPSAWKVNRKESRRLQRRVAERILPKELGINRKQGFSIPLADWLRKDRCRLIEQYRPFLPGCISQTEVSHLVSGHMAGWDNSSRLFGLLMLGLSCKNLNLRA